MDLQVINAVISGLAILGAYLIVKPQKAENAAIHKSIDNNTTLEPRVLLAIVTSFYINRHAVSN